MDSGTRSTEDGRVAEALDRCLGRLRQGDSLEECLADHPRIADELRPLLAVAGEMLASLIEPPRSARTLVDARERFLNVAAGTYARADGDLAASTDEQLLDDALDIALGRVAAGEPVDDVLEDYPAVAASLRPLLAIAAAARGATVIPPRAPTQLARGRDRMFAAAAELREHAAAAAARADGDESLSDALDSCLAQMRRGVDEDHVLEEHAHQSAALRPLLQTATRISEDIVPAPRADLTPGRDRLLAAAADRRETAAGSRGIGARLAEVFGPGRPLSVTRLALAAVVVIAVLLTAGPVAGTVAADALPGEHLYSVKRLNERIALALLFDPSTRDEREAEYSQRRADELHALATEGREAMIENWQVLFREFIDQTHPSDRLPRGWLFVVPLDGEDEGEPETIKLQLTPDTKVDFLGRYGGWDELPPGIGLRIRVKTQDQGTTVLLAVRLEDEEEEGTPTPDTQTTPDATAAPGTTGTVPLGTGTPTIGPTAPLTATATPATFTPTPEETATESASATPSPSVGASQRKPSSRDRYALQGYVETVVDDVTWVVIEQSSDRSADRQSPEVVVDVSALTAERRAPITKGAWVRLMGRWTDEAMTRYEAVSLDSYEEPDDSPVPVGQRCRGMSSVIGRVANYKPLQSLTLEDGSTYDLTEVPRNEVPGGIEPGARVEIAYELCEDGRRKATRLAVLDARPAVKPYRGTIDDASGGQFTLVTRSGQRYLVLFDASTTIVGAAAIEDGQTALVRGWDDGEGRVRAIEIRVAKPESPESPATPVPPASPEPSSTPGLDSPGPTGTPVLGAPTAPAGAPTQPGLAPPAQGAPSAGAHLDSGHSLAARIA